jgi:phage pi2 protein 07
MTGREKRLPNSGQRITIRRSNRRILIATDVYREMEDFSVIVMFARSGDVARKGKLRTAPIVKNTLAKN